MQIKSSNNPYTQWQSYSQKKALEIDLAQKEGEAYSAAENAAPLDAEEQSVVVELSGEQPPEELAQERETARAAMGEEDASALSFNMGDTQNAMKTGTSSPEDNSGMLTKRLVAAISQMEVQQIISEANKNLLSVRAAAASTDKDTAKAARAIVKKLEKLIRRGRRKVTDLNKEDGMRLEKKQAEQQKKQRRAEEIKKELREHVRKRKEREKKYLREDEERQVNAPTNFMLDAATEAKIAQQAQVQAAMEATAPAAEMGGEMGGDMSASAGAGGSGSATGTAEGAAAEGGEVSAE